MDSAAATGMGGFCEDATTPVLGDVPRFKLVRLECCMFGRFSARAQN